MREVVILADEQQVKRDPDYPSAKSGDALAAGRAYSAKLAPEPSLIQTIRDKHGNELETWWQKQFGYGFDCLTQSEARTLERSR
jgi:hypothetical protein